MLGLGHHASAARPTIDSAVVELLEDASGLGRCDEDCLGLRQFAGDHRFQPLVASEPKHVFHAVFLAPAHQFLAGEAAVGPEPDLNLPPSLTYMCHDARDLFFRASRGIDIGLSQLGNEQVASVKDVEWKVAVAAIVSVEKSSFLVAMQRSSVASRSSTMRLGALLWAATYRSRNTCSIASSITLIL